MKLKLERKAMLVGNNGMGGHKEAGKQSYLSNGEKNGFVADRI